MEYNLSINRGLSFVETVQLKNDDNSPLDLTGSSFLLQIRDHVFSTDYRINATNSNGLLAVTPLLGIVDIKLPPTETSKLVMNIGSYDLIQTTPTGDKVKIISGSVTINPTVSRT
jgi:hypothetical protein